MEIKPAWETHEWFKQGAVEMLPIEWVWQYRGEVSAGKTFKDGAGGKVSGMDGLWQSIKDEGLRTPLMMRVGLKNKKFRLEAGNHCIQLLHQHGVTEVPVTVQIRDECGPHVADAMNDAKHNFDAVDEILISESKKEYMRPSEVFRSFHVG